MTDPHTTPDTKTQREVLLHEIAKVASERAGQNVGVAPQLIYAPFLWSLQDMLAGYTITPTVRDDAARVEAAAKSLAAYEGYAAGWGNWILAAREALAAADAVAAPAPEITRLRAEVASLRASLGQAPAREGAEPIGCPVPGACSAAGGLVRHKKRGTTYTVLGEAGLQTEQPLVAGDRLVVYQGLTGDLWARPPHEFEDGRFEDVVAQYLTP